MLNNKNKKLTALLAVVSLLTLAGCDTDEFRIPDDYASKLFDAANAITNQETLDNYNTQVTQNQRKQYYTTVASSDAVYQKTIESINTILAEKAHNYDADSKTGSPVYNIVNDSHDDIAEASIAALAADGKTVSALADKESNLLARSQKSLLSTAKGGSYDDDNLFQENDYAKYLYENFYYLDKDFSTADAALVDQDGQLITPELKYSDVFSSKASDYYNTYMTKELYKDMKVNYLTTEYIYNKSYSSIGNSNARNVEYISLTDRSDEPGDAKKLLDVYVEDFINQKDLDTKIAAGGKYAGMEKSFFTDPDFQVLQRMWKGITKTYADSIEANRYGKAILSDNEEKYMTINGLLDEDGDATLIGKIKVDAKDLKEGQDNWIKLDSSLESTYTGSYTYDTTVGIRKAVDEIAKRSLVTRGWYLKSSGISALPSTLSDRIFSPKVTSSAATIEKMKTSGDRSDLTVYKADGYRYMTVADTITGDETSSIVYYDSSSKTYYLVRMLDVIDTNALSKTNTDTVYNTDALREQVAREVAYTMSTTGSYKTEALVYWYSRLDWTYFDEDFLSYMKSNYKDIFKTENPYEINGETGNTTDTKISLL